jgi:uncharacterized membrane protein
MLLISIVLGLIPLAGIALIIVTGTITTVDGLFESLIMLSLSGIFFLNVFWELRDRGMLGKGKPEPAKPPAASDES